MQRRLLLLLAFCFLMVSPFAWSVVKQYSTGKVLDVQQKTRDKVDMYLVNTPVTTAVPYFEVTVRLGDTDYVAEYTPRHAEEQLPVDWVSGADVGVRLEKHSLFLKRTDGSEIRWIIVRRKRTKEKQE